MSKPIRKLAKDVPAADGELAQVVGQSFRTLRELLGMTQSDLAKRLKIGQAAISKLENRGDVQISSLKKYLEALGARLRIDAELDPDQCSAFKIAKPFHPGLGDRDQLIFPIFAHRDLSPKRDVVLSVQPRYSDKIFEGKKTIELRRRFPIAAPPGTTAFIYSTSPVRAMVGSAEIEDVVRMPITKIWTQFGKKAQVTKTDFDEYFSGLKEGFALNISNARQFARPVNLMELRVRFGFAPPQSFLYATHALRTALRDEYSNVSD